jgi:hypothetical protein
MKRNLVSASIQSIQINYEPFYGYTAAAAPQFGEAPSSQHQVKVSKNSSQLYSIVSSPDITC